MADNSLKRTSEGGHIEGASTPLMRISGAMSRREDVRACAELGLAAIEAYRAIGSPYGNAIAGVEQWLKQIMADVAQAEAAGKEEAIEGDIAK
ncbi:MAG TPA: hypothetical protein VGE45_18625 [Chloroflexia bacterium]|jgi:hypothetical protein